MRVVGHNDFWGFWGNLSCSRRASVSTTIQAPLIGITTKVALRLRARHRHLPLLLAHEALHEYRYRWHPSYRSPSNSVQRHVPLHFTCQTLSNRNMSRYHPYGRSIRALPRQLHMTTSDTYMRPPLPPRTPYILCLIARVICLA
jgi:hypothetical protein